MSGECADADKHFYVIITCQLQASSQNEKNEDIRTRSEQPAVRSGEYLSRLTPRMVPEQKQNSKNPPGSDTALPEPPPIHPSFLQVAKPYIFEQTIQKCMASMAINPLREVNLRLQGVTWIDNVRRELNLYVKSPLSHDGLLTTQAHSDF